MLPSAGWRRFVHYVWRYQSDLPDRLRHGFRVYIASFWLTQAAHTVVILIILLMFAFTAYATNENLGSPAKVYDLLVEAAKKHPVEGNAGGSYLTMRSKEGAIFFVINIVGNFGTVFCDNGYYNKAIAASPVDALPGYVMGGLSW